MVETTSGVLLKGTDGSYYFIPQSELSQYACAPPPDEAMPERPIHLDAFPANETEVDEGIVAAVPVGYE